MSNPRTLIETKVAALKKTSESDVTLARFEEPTPDLYLFQAETPGADPARGPDFTFGVLAGGHVAFGREAIDLVAEVWRYDESRPIPAATVAKVFGLLGSDIEPHTPLLEEGDLNVHKRHRHLVFLPRETTVDGFPAVEYWETTPREPFLLFTVAIFKPGGNVEFRGKEADDFIDPPE